MGQSAAKIREQTRASEEMQEEEKAKIEERLQILERMIKGRLNTVKENILAGERNDQEIHSGKVVEELQNITIVQSQEAGSIKDAVSDFFDGHFMKGLQAVLDTAIDAVLGNASIGEYESSNMFIVWHNNALLRCDVYTYRWNFANKGVIDNCEGVTGAFMCKRAIDMTKTDPQVLTWAVSRQAAALNMEAGSLIDSAMKTLNKVISFEANLRATEAAAGESS